TTQQICTCDTIAVPAGYGGGKEVCVCNTISVGTKAGKTTTPSGCSCVGHVTRPSGCSCVGHVTRGGSHYWRPN
ncbi:MAG: hypothetical protein LBS65_05475, partial [Desulfovibrio sp.]|nr:hypothetical protein [Desulfovibrio sp.]